MGKKKFMKKREKTFEEWKQETFEFWAREVVGCHSPAYITMLLFQLAYDDYDVDTFGEALDKIKSANTKCQSVLAMEVILEQRHGKKKRKKMIKKAMKMGLI